MGHGRLPNFTESDFVLVARDDYRTKEKLSLSWRGPRRVVRAVNDYVYSVEDLRDGELWDVHVTRLKFYHDKTLDQLVTMSYIVNSETGMVVQCLMRLDNFDGKLMDNVRWRGIPNSGDFLEPLAQV